MSFPVPRQGVGQLASKPKGQYIPPTKETLLTGKAVGPLKLRTATSNARLCCILNGLEGKRTSAAKDKTEVWRDLRRLEFETNETKEEEVRLRSIFRGGNGKARVSGQAFGTDDPKDGRGGQRGLKLGAEDRTTAAHLKWNKGGAQRSGPVRSPCHPPRRQSCVARRGCSPTAAA